MRPWSRWRSTGWLPTVVVLGVVVAVGSRLIYLNVQHHAEVARAAAVTAGAEIAAKIEPRLAALSALANQQAAAAAAGRQGLPLRSRPDSLPHAQHTFWMASDDTVLQGASEKSALAGGIAGEWQTAEAARALPAAALLGPVRIGSQWIVAARAPYPVNPAGDGSGGGGWLVAYADLQDIITDAHLSRLVGMGYDFQLSQIVPRDAQPRMFVWSTLEPLTDPVRTRVHLATAANSGAYLDLALHPRSGWYPANLLAADVCLLAFLAWLLAFGTHDMSHALQRSRAALTTARSRVRFLNQQLAAEMQQRLTMQETISHALFHDAFTGLPNRRYFMDRLDRALRDVRAKQRSRIAVVIVDITRFKLVNDLLGHTAGDELMVQAARRFEKSAAGSDELLARWGGDQFALLILKPESTADALSIGARLREQLRIPFQLRRHQLVVAASVGVTCTESGQQRAEDVVREADVALSVAKQREGSKVVLYEPNMSAKAATLVSLEADLHIALEKHQLRLLLQPVVDLRSYRMVGAEALLRWVHPVESVLAPDRFLRIAEDAGLMVPITRWVILRALKIIASWRGHMPVKLPFYISVNLSPTALRDPGLADYVGTLLRETGTPAAFIKFEVTEAALSDNVGAARETLEQLHALGVGLMLDDFGTGFTSLSNLQLFPFDFVKIERPFVNINVADRANTGMMAAMVQMAASLKLTVIAETIESEAAAKALQEMGCDYGQGYYFSEPIEVEQAWHRLSRQEPFEPRATAAAPTDPSPTLQLRPLQNTGATQMVAPLEDAASTMIVAPLEDSASTMMVAPLADAGGTMTVPPLADVGGTMTVPPLGDPNNTMIVAPLDDAGSTIIVAPLEDASATMFVAPLEDTGSTMAVTPLVNAAGAMKPAPLEDTGATMAVAPLVNVAGAMKPAPLEDTSATMAVPPLEDKGGTGIAAPLEDTSSTMTIPPLEDPGDTSSTAINRPLYVDTSLTIELPVLRDAQGRPAKMFPTVREVKDKKKL